MSGELVASGSLIYTPDESPDAVEALLINMSGNRFVAQIQTVGITEEAISLGDLAGTLGWAFFKNLDASNFLEIRTATSGTKIIKLKPGEFALFRFGSGITAPFAISDTAACRLKYRIFEA